MANGLPPGLAGYVAYNQMADQREANQIGMLSRLIGLQQAQRQMQLAEEKRPLELEALRAGIAEKNAAVGARNQKTAAQGALFNMLSTGGYQGETQAPTSVAMTDNDALARFGVRKLPDGSLERIPGMEALSIPEGQPGFVPRGVNVPNPSNIQALATVAAPEQAMTAMLRNIYPEQPKPAAPSALSRLMAERDALPPNDPRRQVYDLAINKQVTPSAGTTVNVNPNAPLMPGKTAANKIDEGLLDTGVRLQQLSAIERQFKPEYQQLGTRLGAAWSSGLDKMGVNLAPQERQNLSEFSQYKRNAIDALNQYIKSVTGAAMSEPEAQRILKGLPNPGQGLFDGDSPIEFEAKLKDAIKQGKMAEARLVYLKRNGMSLTDANGNFVISLDRMPTLMNERGQALEREIRVRQPTLPDDVIRRMVMRNLAQEFGLTE